ncbi:N-acetylglucosamine-6-phosphate deacetylase [Streptococcaceae bacterium ESL0729]|nr:N-acetylglucosamine-6-phosphate deacetylase [Streptococcaceae bacterium ESL0729]
MMKYIKADKFFYPYELKGPGYLELKGGKFGRYLASIPEDSTAEIIDYSGYAISPGLVDTHIHGFAGVDIMDNDIEGVLADMSLGLLETGVTSFLATTLTGDHDLLKEVSENLGKNYKRAQGAKIQGIYFEGPYFTEEYKGAQNPTYFSDPSIEEFKLWQEASGGIIKKIALAPERRGVEEFINQVTSEGVVVALGHSNATLEDASQAVEAGASVWVHAYNAMRGLNHRELGMVGSMFELPHTYAELICDGHHVHPKACHILMEQKGHEHVALITDCMSAGGQADGDYKLGEFDVVVQEGVARLKDGGNLAGSILQLKDALKNVVDWGLASPEEAVRMATLIPALSSKIDDKCGRLKEGRDADFIVLDDKMNLVSTWVDGLCRYER